MTSTLHEMCAKVKIVGQGLSGNLPGESLIQGSDERLTPAVSRV
jgi:hypothetical protein